MTVQRTLAIIKPDAVAKRVAGRIITRVEETGFTILAARLVHLSDAQARGFYAVHEARPFFASLCAFMTQGPSIAMVLERENAIQQWRDLMGATDPAKAAAGTIRKDFASSSSPSTSAAVLRYVCAPRERGACRAASRKCSSASRNRLCS